MPTKWLKERAKGSKNGHGMPPHRVFCGRIAADRWAYDSVPTWSCSPLGPLGSCYSHYRRALELALQKSHDFGPYNAHPTPYTLHPSSYTLLPAPYTIHRTPYTLYPTTHTLYHSTVVRMAALPSGQGHANSEKPCFLSHHVKPPGPKLLLTVGRLQ